VPRHVACNKSAKRNYYKMKNLNKTIKRVYKKNSPNFPSDLEEYLHLILKNSTFDAFIKNAENNLKDYYYSSTEIPINRSNLRRILEKADKESHYLSIFAVGDYIYRKIFDKFDKFDKCTMLVNDITVLPDGEKWQFIMRSLSSQKISPSERIYYSLKTPKIKIDNKDYQVAYSEHCITQIHERLKLKKYNYAALGDTFSMLYENMYFEKVTLLNNQNALCIYGMCMGEEFIQFRIVKEIYGQKYFPGEKYFFKLGYLPLEYNGNYAVAKTILCPGFYTTPEYELLGRSESDIEWLKRANQNERKNNNDSYDFQLIKKMHELGIPQVKIFDNVIYKFQ